MWRTKATVTATDTSTGTNRPGMLAAQGDRGGGMARPSASAARVQNERAMAGAVRVGKKKPSIATAITPAVAANCNCRSNHGVADTMARVPNQTAARNAAT
jgi:hypothetical protein